MIRRFTSGPNPSDLALLVHIVKSFVFFCTIAVFHTIKTFQVGACLRAGNDIISRDRIFHQSLRSKSSTIAPCCFQYFQLLPEQHLLLPDQVLLPRYSFGIPIFMPVLHLLQELDVKSTIFPFEGSAVFRVMACDHLQKCGTVCHILSDRSDLIQRGTHKRSVHNGIRFRKLV